MTTWEIREKIAESGYFSIKDIVAYFKRRYPTADIKIVKEEAKSLITEAKKYSKGR